MSVKTMTAIPSPLTSMLIVGRGVGIEVLRRKEFYVLLILTLIYVTGVIIAGIVGIENQATLVFLINLGISFAYASAHLLTLILSARQIPFALENRTLHPLLAKPLSRMTYLLGKWAALTASGLCVFLVLFVLSWIPWLIFPTRPSFSGGLLAQAMVTMAFSLSLTAALALSLSLVVPQGVNLALSGMLLFAGNNITNFVRARGFRTALEAPLRWITAYLPDFEKLNLFNRYTDGIGALAAWEFLGLLLHATILTAVILVIADAIFSRRPL